MLGPKIGSFRYIQYSWMQFEICLLRFYVNDSESMPEDVRAGLRQLLEQSASPGSNS